MRKLHSQMVKIGWYGDAFSKESEHLIWRIWRLTPVTEENDVIPGQLQHAACRVCQQNYHTQMLLCPLLCRITCASRKNSSANLPKGVLSFKLMCAQMQDAKVFVACRFMFVRIVASWDILTPTQAQPAVHQPNPVQTCRR